MDQPLQWKAFEYHHIEKSSDWFWAVGIIAVSVAITAIIFNNIIFAILILLGGFTISMYAARKPRMVDVELNEKGIILEKYRYPFASLESFWVEEDSVHPKILIKSKKPLMPYIIIPLGNEDPTKVRAYLLKYLSEEEHSESIAHKFIEYLGF